MEGFHLKMGLFAFIIVLLVTMTSVASIMEGIGTNRQVTRPYGDAIVPRALAVPEDDGIMAMASGSFLENLGQVANDGVRLYSSCGPLAVWFCDGKVTFMAGDGEGDSFSVVFDGANCVRPTGAIPELYKTSYFLGSDSAEWRTGVRAFAEVWYDDLWDGIDLRFYSSCGRLKYDVIVATGASTSQVIFNYVGIHRVRIEPFTGDLIIDARIGFLRDSRPLVLQAGLQDGELPASFRIRDDTKVGFDLPKEVRADRPFVIDPGLLYSTFIGGSDSDSADSVMIDVDGNIYIVGTTGSADFPATEGVYSRVPGQGFVAKFNPNCTDLLAATYFGGNCDLHRLSIALSENGSVVVVGETGSENFPTTADAYDRTFNGGDADIFVLVLDPDLTTLLYSSYFGGSGDDVCGVQHNWPDGRLTIFGSTTTRSLPTTPGAFCGTAPGITDSNLFLVTLGTGLASIDQCTYLGGSLGDNAKSMYVDGSGYLYLTGDTTSVDFPTSAGALSTTPVGSYDAFVVKMEPDLSAIIYATLIGGNDQEHPYGIAASANGTTFLSGYTRSHDFPLTPDAMKDLKEGNSEGFLVKLSADGTSLLYSTFFGGTELEEGGRLVFDEGRSTLYLGGMTASPDLPTTIGCYNDAKAGGMNDIYVATFNSTNMGLSYCTYIGGSGSMAATDMLNGMATRPDGSVVIAGCTSAGDFPTSPWAYARTWRGGIMDGVVFAIEPTPIAPPGVPTSLTAISGDCTIDLAWEPPEGAGGNIRIYRVYRGDSPGAETFLKEVFRILICTDENLVNGKYYYYRVSAVNSAGEGPMSTEIKARPLGSPSEPLNLDYKTGNGTITLTWDSPTFDGGSDISGYNVLRGILSTEILPYATVGNVTQYMDVAVDIGSFYFYKVQAINERGPGNISAFVRGKALDVPSVPGELKATPGDGQVALEWSMPSRDGGSMLLGFRIYRGTSASDIAIVATKSIMELTHTDAGLVNGRSYLYYVVAFSEVGEGHPTITVDAIPFTLPGRPMGLTATAGDGWVQLSWGPPESDGGRQVAFYNIFSGDSSGSIALLVKIGNVTSFNHTGITNGITYHYQVQAVTAGGEGPRSDEATARPMGLPGPPTSLAAAVVSDGVKLTWKAPTDLGGADGLTYVVLRGDSPTGLEVAAAMVDGLEWTDATAAGGRTYHYAIRAASVVGPGPLTQPLAVEVRRVPGQVVGLTAVPGDGRVVLQWSAPADDGGSPITGHAILRGLLETGMVEIARSGPGLNYTDATAANGKRYFYAVRAVNAVGPGTMSPTVNATPIGAPGAVGLLKAKASGSTIVLTWAAPAAGGRASVTGYSVYRGTSATDLALLADAGNVLTYTDSTVEKGKTYYYSVVAKSAVGDGQQAQAISAKLPKTEDGPGMGVAVAAGALAALAAVASARRRR